VEVIPDGARAAFEFRHASWDTEEIREILDGAGAALVLPDRPGRRVPPHVTSGWSYVRFHQGNPLGAAYPRSKLRRWADRIVQLPAEDVYLFFNNDPGSAAVRDARTMFELLENRGAGLARLTLPPRPAKRRNHPTRSRSMKPRTIPGSSPGRSP
jgi:uncharacterized protein YecE (DUF72 family)